MTMATSTTALWLALALGCSRGRPPPDGGAPDAGHPAAASLPAPPPRPPARPGELLVDLEESRATVSVVKDRDTLHPVVSTVALRDGRIELDGPSPSARLVVDLLSYDSRIPLRNERLKKVFFETQIAGYDTLELTVPRLPAAVIASLRKDRKVVGVALEGQVGVHGGTSKLAMTLDAAYEKDGALVVKTSAPIEIKVSDLGLGDNLRRLSALCMHDSIDDVVKVEATLRFPAR
jgi:hypothetical protein